MLSARRVKWILISILFLGALYFSYPPVDVTVEKTRKTEKLAATEQVAQEHGVEVGQPVAEPQKEVLYDRWLPLAWTDVATRRNVVERQKDGITVRETTVTRVAQGRINLGLDIAGGTELVYRLQMPEGQELGEGQSNTIQVLKRRIDPGNVKEFRIQPAGQNRILIQVPRATSEEVENLKNRLTRMGRLEFKLAIPRNADKQEFRQKYEAAEQGQNVQGYKKMHVEGDESNPYYLVRTGEAPITGEYLSNVYPARDEYGRPAVGFEFDSVGTEKFGNLTEEHRGWLLAIVLDGTLQSAPRIRERIGGKGQITGNFSSEEVNNLVTVLQAGSLPMDVKLLRESTVGPKLGQDSIRKGIRAVVVSGLLVLLFVGFYYMVCGAIADGALIMNLVLLVGVLGLLGATLTLPGLAGILLTVGMAVDANVLIFERIREESKAGKGRRVALRNGYDRAFSTIVDANITTLLTAIILYLVGTGPVRGFAVTLSVGILLSMFTALVVTRLALETLIEAGWLRKFNMFNMVGTPSLQFSGKRRFSYIASVVVLAIGLGMFFTRGSSLYDIDFTGGSLAYLSLDQDVQVERVRERLGEAGFGDAEVQEMSAGGEAGKSTFAVRLRGFGSERIEQDLKPQAEKALKSQGLLDGGEVTVGADGQALQANLQKPVSETAVREALSAEFGGSKWNLERLDTILSNEDTSADRYQIHLPDSQLLIGKGKLWNKARKALAWASVRTAQHELSKGEVAPAGDGGPATLQVTVTPATQAEVLGTELWRRGFSEVDIEVANEGEQEGEKGATFRLTGSEQRLRDFHEQVPSQIRLPAMSIENKTVTAELSEEASEPNIRSFFTRQGIDKVYVVPLGAESSSYRLDLGDRPLKRRLGSVFSDMAGGGMQVSFEETGGSGQTTNLRVKLADSRPMPFIMDKLDDAGLGADARELLVEDFSAEVNTTAVTLAVPAHSVDLVKKRIRGSFSQPQPIQKIVSIGSTVADEMKGRALLAVLCASIIIVFYVALRFHAVKFGVAAVIALLHDVGIAAGLVALANWTGMVGSIKIDLPMLAAFLTIIGYSLNDSIVVFDRIRENMVEFGEDTVNGDLVNTSINQTLSRTVLTSLTTLMVVLVLFILGGPVLRGLAFTLIVGVLVGTYSSMFIASPVLLDWKKIRKGTQMFFKLLLYPVKVPFKLLGRLT